MRAAQEVAEKNVRNAEQEVKREKREMQQARERAARRASNAARNLEERRPAEDLRRRDEARRAGVGGQAATAHAARVGDARARLDEAGRALRDDQKIALELPGTDVPAGRTVFLGQGTDAADGGRTLFAGDGSTWPSADRSGSR